jgi:hypothetical protein
MADRPKLRCAATGMMTQKECASTPGGDISPGYAMSNEGAEAPVQSPSPAAERMRRYRRRLRWKRLVVRVELEPAEIEVLVKRGYLDPGHRENFGAIQEAANNFISDALVTS